MSAGVTVLLAVSVALNVIMMYREVNRWMWKRKRRDRSRGRGGQRYYNRGYRNGRTRSSRQRTRQTR